MSKTEIQVGDKLLVSLKEATRHTTYTRDYLAKLAREEKIEAKHVGRQWFVDLDSLRSFIKRTTHEQEERKLRLREERKRERLTKQKLTTLNEEKELKIKALPLHSLSSSLSVLVLGVFVGAFFYTHFNFSEILKIDFKNNASVFLAQNEKSNSGISSNIDLSNQKSNHKAGVEFTDYPLFIDRSEVRSLSNPDSGILLLPQVDNSKEEELVNGLFSDPVETKSVDGSEGVITYTKRDGEKINISFVSVPNSSTEKEVDKNNSP